MSIFVTGKAQSTVSVFYITTGKIEITSKTIYSLDDYKSLIDFIPLSRNRKYNVGLDENNKYPEDYNENYADLLKG